MQIVRIILGLLFTVGLQAFAVEDTGLFDGSDTEVSVVTNTPPPATEVKDPKTGWDKEGKAPPEKTPETPEEPSEGSAEVASTESDGPETVTPSAPVLNLPPPVDHGTNTVEEVEEPEPAEPLEPEEKVSSPSVGDFEPSEQVTAGAAVAFPADI